MYIIHVILLLFLSCSLACRKQNHERTATDSSAIILDLFVVFRISDSLMNQSHNKESDSRVNENKGK